jgi:ubiquinone/menaquinone biosynthesis C-methylase UbiE
LTLWNILSVVLTEELNELACRVGKCAELSRLDPMRDLERSVCGCDYGSTGNTTRLEAEQISRLLELRPGARLLDVGAGSGWPGLYLAQITGCDVVVVDIPLAALRIARERAATDGLAERCRAVAADGAALPFRDASFDALNHSDVLCCTPDKLGVLRACRRVARDGSRMTFTTISLAPSLAASERRIAIECAPKFVESDEDEAVLLGRSGWSLQERTDLTAAFLQFMRAELDGMRARADALAKVFGPTEFTERMKRQQAGIAAIDSGFLRRELFVARADR